MSGKDPRKSPLRIPKDSDFLANWSERNIQIRTALLFCLKLFSTRGNKYKGLYLRFFYAYYNFFRFKNLNLLEKENWIWILWNTLEWNDFKIFKTETVTNKLLIALLVEKNIYNKLITFIGIVKKVLLQLSETYALKILD